jgi:hypothetical protein
VGTSLDDLPTKIRVETKICANVSFLTAKRRLGAPLVGRIGGISTSGDRAPALETHMAPLELKCSSRQGSVSDKFLNGGSGAQLDCSSVASAFLREIASRPEGLHHHHV